MSEPHLEDLPEAVPLYRVSPGWRVAAILAFLLGGLMFALVVVLAIVAIGLRAQLQIANLSAASSTSFGSTPPAVETELPPDTAPDEPAEAVNLPYPVRDDLRQAALPRRPKEDEPVSPRDRFLRKSQEVWKCPTEQFLPRVALSPDGQYLAYFQGDNLIAGSLANPQSVTPDEEKQFAVPGGNAAGARDHRLVGDPTWSADSRHVYCADVGGRLWRYNVREIGVEVLRFRGQSPVPIPGDPDRIVFVRSRPVAKVETPGMTASADPVEIVVGNLKTGKMNVVLPLDKAAWNHLTVSPNGKQLAAVSNRGHPGKDFLPWRLFVGDLADGKMKPLTRPAGEIGSVGWTADGQALLYARTQNPLPPDCWANTEGYYRATDLFEYNLAAQKETRLSRGGGFLSPSLGSDGSLYFLTAKPDNSLRNRPRVGKMTLAAARQFAQTEPELPVRDVAAWAKLLEQVCPGAEMPAQTDTAALDPKWLGRVAERFEKVYRAQFKEEAPATPAALDHLIHGELASLNWERTQRAQLIRVLGAVQGEFLRRKHAAEWHLVAGPLTQTDTRHAGDESAFGFVFNPFLLPTGPDADDERDGENRGTSLEFLLRQAEGRPVLLTNDPAAGAALLAKRVDPRFDAGTALLRQGKSEEAENVLLDLAEKGNLHLALQIGRLLYDHDRKEALRKLMERRCGREPRDARQYNLLGVAVLETAPEVAITAFKKALRCDLYFGPAYLNLARAYQKIGETRSARMCLKRYLDLMGYGPLAQDAAQRLAALERGGER